MKKTLLLILLSMTILVADNLLKEGKYSWYGGGSLASLTVKKDKANGYGILGEAIHGLKKREVSFTGFMKNGKLVYKEGRGLSRYTITLTLRDDGSFDIKEKDFAPFIHTVRFAGHFTSDDNPSFNCKRAKTFTEKAICDNKGLARLDRKMAKHYSLLKSGLFYKEEPQKSVERLKKEQRVWIQKRNSCKNEKMYLSCYEHLFFQRINQLKRELVIFQK